MRGADPDHRAALGQAAEQDGCKAGRRPFTPGRAGDLVQAAAGEAAARQAGIDRGKPERQDTCRGSGAALAFEAGELATQPLEDPSAIGRER